MFSSSLKEDVLWKHKTDHCMKEQNFLKFVYLCLEGRGYTQSLCNDARWLRPSAVPNFLQSSVTLTLAAAADDQLRDARVHVDYSAAVERRGRWREETRRRVLQRERLPREVRVAMPQPAHHAHFCRVQTSPGMSEYDIIPDPRCVNISFNATF